MFRSIPFKVGCGAALAWGLILVANAVVSAQTVPQGQPPRPAFPNQVRPFPIQPFPQPLSNQPFNLNLGQLGGMFGQLGQFGNAGNQGNGVNGQSFNQSGFIGGNVVGFSMSGSANQFGGLLLGQGGGNFGSLGGISGSFQGGSFTGGVNGFNTGSNLGNMNIGMFGAQGAGGFGYLPQTGPDGHGPGILIFHNIGAQFQNNGGRV